MLRKLILPALAALALTAGAGTASAKTYFNFSVGVGTPYYGDYYGGPYGYHGYPYPYPRPGFGFRPYPYTHCQPVVVGYRKVWSERRHRWVKRAIVRQRCF